jgi:hypothetical protein
MNKLIILVLILTSHTGFTQSNAIQVKVSTSSSKGDKDSLFTVTTNYFDIELHSTTKNDGSKYFTTKKNLIKKYVNDKNFTFKFMFVCNDDGSVKKFNTEIEFLDFMLKGGYEMVSSNKEKYHTDYVFKKQLK